jgi:hypothetical protein
MIRYVFIYFRIALLWICVSTSFIAYGQQFRQNIRGSVIDRDTRRALSDVVIFFNHTDTMAGSYTDTNGQFMLSNLPIGRFDLKATAIGYQPVILYQLQLNSGKEFIIQIEMSEQIQEMGEIKVTANRQKNQLVNDLAVVSARTLRVEETQRFAASFNDPARMAVSFAGVNTSDDASNEIIVRGNSARGMLWRIEGIEVPSPNHFSNGEGGSGGGISMLSSQVIGTSDFLTGAFPAEYGNASSGVFDIRYRRGNYRKREYALQLGILGMQACLEGPFSKDYNGSYLINYRYSTLTMLNAIGLPIVDNALVPQFQDLSFHFFLPSKNNRHQFGIWGLGGLSTAGDLAAKDSTLWDKPADRYEDQSRQILGVTGLTHHFLFKNRKTYLRTVLAVTVDESAYRMDSLDNNLSAIETYRERYRYGAFRLNSYINHKFNTRHMLRMGGTLSHLNYSLYSGGYQPAGTVQGVFVDESGGTQLLQAYAQWKYAVRSNLDFTTGLHYSCFLLNGNQSAEPRAGIQWRFAARHSLSIGAGIHSRVEAVSVYLTKLTLPSGYMGQPNKFLPLSRAGHLVLGHNWTLTENMRLKTEVYGQYLTQVAVDTTNGQQESLVNSSAGLIRSELVAIGIARNYGLEATLERSFSNHLFFMLTGSLFQSQYSIDHVHWYNTRFNANYMLNALGGYEILFGRNKQSAWGFNSRIIWRGGNRYTPIDEQASLLSGSEVKFNESTYNERVSDYFRIDISTNVRFNFPSCSFIVSTEIQNVTNRLNINRYYFDPYTKSIRTVYMFGIMPVFNVKVEF